MHDQVMELKSQPMPSRSTLDELVRAGAQKMLQAALEAEVEAYVEHCKQVKKPDGRRAVVRNGSLPEREVLSGAGPLKVKQPRVHDQREGERFSSKILPPYLRKSPSLDALIPALYLKGVSTGQFREALEAILGPDAAGLSATTITGLLKGWQEDCREWSQRDLSEKEYVYWWADGIHFNVRLEEERTCILVLMGTLKDGRKELVGIVDGYRESKISWLDLLRGLKARGFTGSPKLAVGDGALGFWAALREEFPATVEQRCWVHKTSNVLNKMPKRVQPRAKDMIHEIYLAETRADARAAFDQFLGLYADKYPKATQCLAKDKDALLAFYDFPAKHWQHLRTTNPIESTFATVRHRTRRTKGNGSRKATLAMVFQLCREAQRRWRRISGYDLILKLYQPDIRFVDGIETKAA